jgi:2-polyprenyl-6-methoxyphenol hydroxylase-like FAD-dependent oxidoreductase
VGLTAALSLAGQGVAVRIIDSEQSHPLRPFPVLLHAASLRILEGLRACTAEDWRGRLVTQLSIRSGGTDEASLDLSYSAGARGGVLVLPQDILRQALTQLLARLGVAVEWNSALLALQQGEYTAVARVRQSSHSHKVLFPRQQAPNVLRSIVADYVVGADGYDSTVRSSLGLKLLPHGPLETFTFFEAATEQPLLSATLALQEGAASSVYPIAGNRARFCFQTTLALHRTPDLRQLQELVASRLPGCRGALTECHRSGVVEFRRALALRFGAGRVWLAGEAAHTTGPIGAHSINIGMREASQLALAIGQALSRSSSHFSFGEEYDAARAREWRALLGLERNALGESLLHWVERDLERIIPCLPASGGDLSELLGQLMAHRLPSERVTQPGLMRSIPQG